MINRPTVFIVGAGASAGYGFPLGAQLVRDVVGMTAAPTGAWFDLLSRAGFNSNDLVRFSDNLKDADPESIDTFLEGNTPTNVAIGKTAIGLLILRMEQLCREDSLFLGAPGRENRLGISRDVHAASHWLGHVWNLMRPGSTPDNLHENKVQFVVFNYDRTIEHYFDTVLAATYNLEPDAARQLRQRATEIVHLHGALPEEFAFGTYDGAMLAEGIRRLASGIRVIHERQDDGAANEAFARVRQWLERAPTICFVGFGYHPTNIERLGIRELTPDLDGHRRGVYASCFRLGYARRIVAQNRMNKPTTWGDPNHRTAEFLNETVPLE